MENIVDCFDSSMKIKQKYITVLKDFAEFYENALHTFPSQQLTFYVRVASKASMTLCNLGPQKH